MSKTEFEAQNRSDSRQPHVSTLSTSGLAGEHSRLGDRFPLSEANRNVERMQSEAASAKAEGVVGVDMHEGSHRWQTHVIEFLAIGTAVLPLSADIAPDRIADPIMVLSVNE